MPTAFHLKLRRDLSLFAVIASIFLMPAAVQTPATNLDLAFGSKGSFTTTMCGGGVGGGDVYIQPSGRTVVVFGTACPGTMFTTSGTGIVGITETGQLDPQFGSAGKILLWANFGITNYLGSAMQPDGKLLVYYASTCADCGLANYVLFRMTPNGATDPTFNAVVPSVTHGGYSNLAVTLSPDGKITVILDTTPGSLIRFNPDGSRDQTFGSNGIKSLPSTRLPNTTIAGMVIDEKGKIVIGYNNGTVARFNSDGELDRSFGRQGVATEYLGAGRGITFAKMVRQPDGKLLLAGGSANPQNLILFRYTQRGRADASFGTGGIVDRPVGPGPSSAYGVAFLPDGRLVVTGTSTANSSAGVLTARYASDGTLERFARTSFADLTASGGSSIALRPDGKIVTSANAAPPNYLVGYRAGLQVLRFTDSDFGKAVIAKLNDFDGDGRTDLSVYRRDPTDVEQSYWAVMTQYGDFKETYFGVSGDIPVPQDYDSDGKTDIAVFRPSNGTWYYKTSFGSEDFTAVQFGQAGDIPVPSDFDGDGNVDLAVYRPGTFTWYIRNSSNGSITIKSFGSIGQVPVTGDFDGDGRADIATFDPQTAGFAISRSADGLVVFKSLGSAGDIPVIADYDGDRVADLATFSSNGTWRYIRSFDNQTITASWGAQGDIPVIGDYSGDGKADLAVFRPAEANWYATWPTNSGFTIQFGVDSDLTLPGR
ncbi:MAG: FG-GAP-like repeat-containing protein [Acidobacteriota bacterium]